MYTRVRKNKRKRGILKLNKRKLIENKIKFNRGVKKTIAIIALVILNSLTIINSVYAENINSANIYTIGDCGKLLTYKGIPVKVSYVQYMHNEIAYPAYCLDKTKPGAESGEYAVSVQSAIQDVGLWRRIINGYPYKTIEELGVANKEEAFTATKQAVYCYIHGNNPEDYGAIGEAGERTLRAMKNIINNAQNSNETKISSTITINKNTSDWKQDEKEKDYVSKLYSVQAGANIENYKVTIKKESESDLGGIKLTDENNLEKSEFSPDEKFKILIPIKNMREKTHFNILVEAKVETKPVLYGMAPTSTVQDYALTAATYEDGIGSVQDEYQRNETKIIIIKKDQDDGKLLKGVEFELLNESQQTVYTDLKTDEGGKIIVENLVPGIYYIKETKTIDGYQIYDQPIKVEIELNQEITVTVNNLKEELPEIDTKTKTSKEVKKLPVTGM